jgi:outer membrane protein assembly factor BamB
MKTRKNKTIPSTVLIVLLIFGIFTVFPIASAHTPPWNIKTYAYLSVEPNPIGINQQALIYMWLSNVAPTAEGGTGDRWEGYTVDITKPDGTKQTLGPITADPASGGVFVYSPSQTGKYTFQGNFPGQTLAGKNLYPNQTSGIAYIGDYYEPSKTNVVELTVKQDPIPPYPSTPLPAGYWTRPITAEFRDWYTISGDWLVPKAHRRDLMNAPYTAAPETAHILWAKSLDSFGGGGLIGGEYGAKSYHDGGAYEGMWTPPLVISGVLFYNIYPASFNMNGVAAIDLRTGVEVWNKPNMPRLAFGQIYYYGSPNQYGGIAYLWATVGTTWQAYNPVNGDLMFTITNVPSGTQAIGPNGEVVRYQLSVTQRTLTMWNNTAIPEELAGLTGSNAWMWRPGNKTVDGRRGYSWNVSLTTTIPTGSSIVLALNDRLICRSDYTHFALSLKQGEIGRLMWSRTLSELPNNVTIIWERPLMADVASGVFIVGVQEELQWYGFDINSGTFLWKASSQRAWDYYQNVGGIVGDKFFSTGWSGVVSCYNVKTGVLLWTYEAYDETGESMHSGNYPLRLEFVADGKIYVSVDVHSSDNPKFRGAKLYCLNATTGKELWSIPHFTASWANGAVIGDGIIATLSTYDSLIYAYGKGLTQTTVAASPKVSVIGSSILIEGTVTDQSPGAKNTPAIADDNMTEWMKYLYMQYPIPSNVNGVQVKLSATDPNGNTQDIGTVSSDKSGMFKKMWTPPVSGEYTIIATFEGSKAYYTSYSQTAIGVTDAPALPTATATPTNAPTATIAPSATITASPSPVPNTGSGIGTEVYIAIAAVAIIAVVAAVALLLRKR